MQVLEHVPEPAPFARRLMELGRIVLISVPYKWPKGSNKDHVNDPVDLAAVTDWFGGRPNYHLVVREPFHGAQGRAHVRDLRRGEPRAEVRRRGAQGPPAEPEARDRSASKARVHPSGGRPTECF